MRLPYETIKLQCLPILVAFLLSKEFKCNRITDCAVGPNYKTEYIDNYIRGNGWGETPGSKSP